LAQKYNLVPKPVQQRTCANISDEIKNAVHKFYLRDDVSYQLPGKRDTIVVKNDDNTKITYQKRILLNNLRESFELFIEENKEIIISHSSFADFRPPFVVPKAALAQRICVCIYHENANLILKAIDKFVKENVCSSLQRFTGTLVCNSVNQECMFLACPLCESNFQEKVIDNVCEQSKYFEQLKSEVTDEKVVIQVDFAENVGLKEQDEIQSVHWNTKTLSIFTAYVWSKSQGFSFMLPSNDVSHDKFVVNSATEIILNELKTHVPSLKQTDSFLMAQPHNLSNILCHGKGVVDGLGGTVKRLVWSAALAGDNCKSAKDFVKLAQQNTKKIIIIEIKKNDIDNSKLKLENIFKVAKSVLETLKTHSVKSN
ncbi:unnamed protein product, partial [Didymodactylos carnosus]